MLENADIGKSFIWLRVKDIGDTDGHGRVWDSVIQVYKDETFTVMTEWGNDG